jgi:pyoverdine/dityrosine biosynthesis protein Dit1
MLLKSEDAWATPWHRVTLVDGKKHRLIRKQEAEAMNAKPIFTNDKFSHYVLI